MQIADFNTLMERVAAGSEEAVWQLAELYSPHILSVVRRTLGPQLRQKLDSVDIVQTLWASLLLKPSEMTRFGTPEQLIAFLARATKNKVIDKARHFSRQKNDISREVDLTDCDAKSHGQDPTPSSIASVRERWQIVVSACTDEERKILAMRQSGDTYDKIGDTLSISRHKAQRVIDNLVEQFVAQ